MCDSNGALHRPTSRNARLHAIEEALADHVVTSQSQLSQILADQGIEVTQATLSRDLDEMNAVKTRLVDGTVAYTLEVHAPADEAAQFSLERAQAQMAKVLPGLVTSVAHARNLIVVHTSSGAAQYVASVVDKHAVDGILGTIAGDDTVMVICTDDALAQTRADWLLSIASSQ
ncbi:arginine repressor [Bifidobacterium cuniculi]|uniref:Arginine repressor n=1 Tax=Bifidobacterium cuniculi TaxID=1688 RepID=A0A087AQB7_9BIFI|nr:arginine repressor [Bifidobacterium cuniculi]KFI60967.1 arginine repressor [Bifidobacterium cuniculi]